MSYYIGLMSGTSMDGIDAALVSFESESFVVHATTTSKYDAALQTQLIEAIQPEARLTLHEFGTLNVKLGRAFADTVENLLGGNAISRDNIVAIGSHGQTLRHSPDSTPPYTLQIGDPATIATRCGLPTVADFRSLDVAAGGQGAPLVPPFHEAYFRAENATTIVLNIGGIANITVLPADPEQLISGFDTGPGNCLLDEWIALQRGVPFDENGNWGKSGSVSAALLSALMNDRYIARAPAKSTGREYFNMDFLMAKLRAADAEKLPPEDIQATLCAYTVESIAEGIGKAGFSPDRLLVCGGGVHNELIMNGLRGRLENIPVAPIERAGANADFIEAIAFAWLACQRLKETPVRLTTGTDRIDERVLGALYLPSPARRPGRERHI